MVHVAPRRVSFFKQTVLILHLVYDCFYHESMSRQVVTPWDVETQHKWNGILFHGSTMNLDLLGFHRLRESGGPIDVPSQGFLLKAKLRVGFSQILQCIGDFEHMRLIPYGMVLCDVTSSFVTSSFCKRLLQLLEVLWFTGFFCLGILFNHMVCITTKTKGGIVVRSLQPSKKQQNWSGLSCHLLIVIPIYESHYFLSTSLGMLDGMGCKNAQQHRHLFRRKISIKILAL